MQVKLKKFEGVESVSRKILVLSVGSESNKVTGVLLEDFIEKAESLGLSTEKLVMENEELGLFDNDLCMNVMDMLSQQDDMDELFEKITLADIVVFFAAV